MRVLFVTFLAAGAFANLAVGADTPKTSFLAPPEVLRLADAYISSLPHQPDAPQTNDIRAEFVRWFFWGFVDPNSEVSSGPPSATLAGLKAGKQYRRSNPEKLKQTMEGFGYTVTNAQGTWTVGFEHSGFRPDGHSGREWWLSLLPVEGGSPIDQAVPAGGGRVRISGFLSPKGQYGHLGGYDHEFFATNISVINVGQPHGPADGSQPLGTQTNRASTAAGSRR
jgi:hypothetical protein